MGRVARHVHGEVGVVMCDLWIMGFIVAVMGACAIIGSRLRDGSFGQSLLLFCAAVCMMLLVCVQWQV